ncbi:PQQ-binding-like beta-propeller repeat protein [Halorhabdus tiamatea]|uniref:PQQ-binding-like beta-propeller repeat protein n=1 Tax=Halorhabdus tiamatea TaxID=430914 RepID=UPI00130D5BD4|nr:PQQ-binding-like beta-propeller repeat protein [Halorhabdus tiamatea]
MVDDDSSAETTTPSDQPTTAATNSVPATGSWPMDGVNPANSGSTANWNGPADGITKGWDHSFRGNIYEPIVADGVVFLGVEASEGRATPTALDARTGEKLWSVEQPKPYGSPTYHDGMFYVGSYGGLMAIEADTGEVSWKFDTTAVRMVPHDGVMYVSGSEFGAIDLESQEFRWTAGYETTGEIGTFGGLLLASDDTLLVPGDNAIGAFDAATGEAQWIRDHGDNVSPEMAVAGDVAYLLTTSDAGTSAIEAYRWGADETLWTYEDAQLSSTMSVANGRVYASRAESPGLLALDAETGEQLPGFSTDVGPISGRPSVAGDTVYGWAPASDINGTLSAIDGTTGEIRWTYTGESGFPPQILEDTLYYMEDWNADRIVALTSP